MQNGNDFVELRPKVGKRANDVGAYTEMLEQMKPVSEEQAQEIDECRIEFVRDCFLPYTRRTSVYQVLGHKAAFICKHGEWLSDGCVEALLADRSTLFSDRYENSQVNRSILNEKRMRFGTDNRQLDDIRMAYAWEKYSSTKSPQQRDRLAVERRPVYENTMEMLLQHARKTRNGINYYAREMRNTNEKAPDGQEPQALLELIRDWAPDTALKEAYAVDFYVRYFQAFMSADREYQYLKKDCQHFKGDYMQMDVPAYQAYQKEKERLNSYRASCTQWNKVNGFPFVAGNEWAAEDGCNEKIIAALASSVQEHLQTTRGKAAVDTSQVKEAFAIARNDNNLAAIRFLRICLHNRDRIIERARGKREIDIEKIEGCIEHIYLKRESKASQRTAQLKLLLDVCRILQYGSRQVETNLLYYLKYHGYVILSEAEAELWKTGLEEYNLMETPVSLAWHYYDDLKHCLIFDPDELYCCETCSAMHLDGFMAWLENVNFSRYKSGQSKAINVPEDAVNQYLKEWSSGCPNLDHIREICTGASKGIGRKNIDKWIVEWNMQSEAREHWVPYKIDSDELYRLVVETIIQQKIIERARKILLEKTDKLI